MSEEQKTPNLDNWSDFSGEFLKADYVEAFPLRVLVKQIEATEIKDTPVLNIIFEYQGKDKKLSLNKTNRNFLVYNGVNSPKAIIGLILTFDKVKVRNPQGESVNSFEIVKVEKSA